LVNKKDVDSVVQRPKRWDQPFCSDMSADDVVRILAAPHFCDMTRSNFPNSLKLASIIRNDCQIRRFVHNQIIVREGEYVNSAFLVLSGVVAMLPPSDTSSESLARISKERPSTFSSVLQWLRRNKLPEVRDSVAGIPSAGSSVGDRLIEHLSEDVSKNDADTIRLIDGDIFGESAVLGRSEMTNTVVALCEVEVLEIRWQGLRDIRKRESGFKETIDNLYRERGLYYHLMSVPLFSNLSTEKIRELASVALFEVHGEFEWQKDFQKVSKQAKTEEDYNRIIESEPVIALEGDYPDGLLLVRNGFGRISRYINFGHYTMGYLSHGGMFGLEELYDAWKNGKATTLHCSFRALGYTDVIRIPTDWLEINMFSENAPETTKVALKQALMESRPTQLESNTKPVDRKLTEFLVENRLINGTASMVIDLERCVRCDDCVSACASAHDNNPRFNRHGKSFGRYMIANACMHCEDPVCMIGCPTGAIHRSPEGVVKITDSACIGCSTCANNCPYDNIRMVEIRDASGNVFAEPNGKPIIKASKCDLCAETSATPACERACSHDALKRIDLKDITNLTQWIDR